MGILRKPPQRGLFAVVLAFTTAPVITASTVPSQPPGAQVATTAPIEWKPCEPEALEPVPPEDRFRYGCSTYSVPTDHDDASLGTIDIALMRRTVNRPETRIGSLFLNPGGPGGSGLAMPIGGDGMFEPSVLDRFDLVGFDPRGVGASSPLRCFTTEEEAEANHARQWVVPVTESQIAETLGAFKDYGQICGSNAGTLIEHMSTKDVVRDLDLLRAAVGDETLNFVGFSYGTLIGATYANMFPGRTRALVLDGNVDPALRTADGLRYDSERAAGFEISLNAFFAECTNDAARCAFSDGDPRTKFDELRNHLRDEAITLPDGEVVDLGGFTGKIAGALYAPAKFSGLAGDLQALYSVINPAAWTPWPVTGKEDLPTLLGPQPDPRYDGPPDTPYTADDSHYAVNCADKAFAHTQADVPGIAAEWERASPTFGRSQAFGDPAACPEWPATKPDAYGGPWDVTTEHPVLVLGNYYDPATRYEFARRMADQLGNARLVSADAHGHCILAKSAGIDALTAAYLVDLEIPAPNQVFRPDAKPFDPPPAHA